MKRTNGAQICLSGGIGRRTGLKILRESNPVPVQVRPEAPFMEKYPSLVEGTGLENQEVGQLARGFESLLLRQIKFLKFLHRGVEQFGSSSGS